MRYVPRRLEPRLLAAARAFPALVLTGPRRAGKTTLLRHAFPGAAYALLEDPETLARVKGDPRGFLASLRPPAILDEIQNAPELLAWVRAEIDRAPRRSGRWLLTGSQEAGLMRGVSESMAGRAAIFELLPLSRSESSRVSLFRGGYPEVLARPSARDVFYRSYVQTYLERDVRQMLAVRDLASFRRFIALVATRAGQLLNRTDLAAPLGVSIPTISQWLGVLETTGQILLVPPFYENAGKRLVKSPKLYFTDSGLLAHLLGIESVAELERSPFLGPLFEGFVASEIAKEQAAAGRRRELYHFRDQQGLEVDFVVPLGNARLGLIEAKAGHTVLPRAADGLVRLREALPRHRVRAVVVHRGGSRASPAPTLRPGVGTLTEDRIGELFAKAPRRSSQRADGA
jgi:hypothetical protein